MPKTLTFDLSASSIDKVLKELDKYTQDFPQKVEKLTENIAEQGVQLAKSNLAHIDTGETLNSIHKLKGEHGWLVRAGGHAVWIEFGTGVYAKGQRTHPRASATGMKPHGTYGKGNGANPNGWWYFDKEKGWRHTKGIAANMFLYNAGQQLLRDKRYIQQAADEVFKDK